MEVWRRIRGFPGYEVSSEGRVRSYKDSHGRVTNDWHLLKPIMNNRYYRVVLFDKDHVPCTKTIHRLVAETFMPVQDESLVVDHVDCDKTNNSLSNLEWVTCRENSVRAFDAGLYESIFEVTRRPVLVTDLWTGEELYFEGINDAARQLGYSPSILSRAANMLCDRVGHYVIEFAGPEERLLYDKNYI